jgi:hypothetical protein
MQQQDIVKPQLIRSKFKVGDKVYLNERAPEEIRNQLHARARTIVRIEYNLEKQCVYYYLGENNKGNPLPWFRGYMLRKEKIGHRVARVKRKYVRKTSDLPSVNSEMPQVPFEHDLPIGEEKKRRK